MIAYVLIAEHGDGASEVFGVYTSVDKAWAEAERRGKPRFGAKWVVELFEVDAIGNKYFGEDQ